MTVAVTDNPENQDSKLDLSASRAAKKQHDQIIAWTKSQYQAIRNARTTTERQWYINMAFFYGRQNVAVLPSKTGSYGGGSTVKLWVPPAPYWRVRPVINRIRPTIRHELAQLTNNKPSASITPASAEDRDVFAAQAGEQIWENAYIDLKFKQILRQAVWWNQVCGNGFIKSWWDPNELDSYNTDPATGQPLKGKVCIQSETPFNILVPDFREEEIENQPYLIHATIKSRDWVMARFGGTKTIDGTQLDFKNNETGANDLFDDSFLNMMGTQALNKQHNVLIFEVWIKPGGMKLFPEGAMFTVIGDKIVQGQQGLPYSHNMYPFAKLAHIPGGKFYATSSVEDLIPLQKEYNRTRGQVVEAKNKTSKPQLLAQRGSVDASKITTEPGQVIEYTPGFEPPRPLPLVALPNYVIEEQDRILADWNDISGQHDVSKGQVPPGVTAATAISYLQERDESNLSPTFDSVEEAIEKTARLTLSYVHDYWDVERLIKTTGADGSFDVMTFKGSDLANNLDIRIEAGSSLPVSKAAKQALITDWMKMGFISPQKGMEVMDMGGINKIYEQIQVDQKQAQRENLRLSKIDDTTMQEWQAQQAQTNMLAQMSGQSVQTPLIVPVNTWDNHQAHIEVHNNFRKSQAFENLPEVSKAQFEAHVNNHIQAMGIEQYTMNPNVKAGLPPIQDVLGQQQPGQQPSQGQPSNPIDNTIAKGGPDQQAAQQPGLDLSQQQMPPNLGGM